MTTIPNEIPAMAALKAGPTVELYKYPVKPLAAKDVDFHVLYNGVCASDLHMIENHWGMSRYPLVPGHEVIGKVLAVGPDVQGIQVGDIVGLGCLAQKCDKCEWCTRSLDNICPERKFTYFGNTVDETGEHVHHGGFSSYIRTDYRGLFKIPEGYSAAHAGPLMCAGLTVSAPLQEFCGNSFNASGKKIGVLGLGGLGHLAVQFASKMGAEVGVLSRGDGKKKYAAELGATRFINTESDDELKAAAQSFDMIMVCISGGNVPVSKYLPLLRPYGVLHFVGVPAENITLNVMELLFNRLSIAASPIGSSEQMRAMIDFAAKHNIKPEIELFKHSQANAAIEKVRNNTIRFRAVLENDLA